MPEARTSSTDGTDLFTLPTSAQLAILDRAGQVLITPSLPKEVAQQPEIPPPRDG